ncbi:hypothetical protein ABG067_006489 [Albugo candida]
MTLETIKCPGSNICFPFLSPLQQNDRIHYISAGTGEILEYSKTKMEHKVIVCTGGVPLGACFDANGTLHIVDAAHAAILRSDSSNQPEVLVTSYEDQTFRGPSSIILFNDGTIFFTDSGPFGETTLENRRGSVFCIGPSPSGDKTLRPLLYECLAHPCAISKVNDDVLLVAEMMMNRILRLVRTPGNIYHSSVFYQCGGGLGPSSVICDTKGNIFVGHYDFAHTATKGHISVLNERGAITHTLQVPGPEITGLCLSRDEAFVYVTESSTNSIYCVPTPLNK